MSTKYYELLSKLETISYSQRKPEHRTIVFQARDAIKELDAENEDYQAVNAEQLKYVKEAPALKTKIKQLETQLNLDGTKHSQRCDRCHLANFFNGDEFKCWNCGFDHLED